MAIVAGIVFVAVQPAVAAEWWMLGKDDQGKSECKPPLEGDGVVLTPDVILDRFEECKLMDETPSLDLDNVFVACEGNLNQVFIFSKSKEGCGELAKSMSGN
jgi:hypothetical protein